MKEFGLSTLRTIAISAFTVLAVYGIQTQASSWTAPGSTPPNGNVAGPITTSGGQTINGNLSLGNNGNLWVGGRVYVPDVWLSSVNKWASEMGGMGGTVVGGCISGCWGGATRVDPNYDGAPCWINVCPAGTTERNLGGQRVPDNSNGAGDRAMATCWDFFCTKN